MSSQPYEDGTKEVYTRASDGTVLATLYKDQNGQVYMELDKNGNLVRRYPAAYTDGTFYAEIDREAFN